MNQISQIYITDKNDDQVTNFIKDRIETVKHYFGHLNYVMYNGNTLRDFIQENFDADVLWAYDCLKPYAYKTDLGKYCILYKIGGWYADVTTNMINYPNIPEETSCILFKDIQTEHYIFNVNTIANNLMYAKPGLQLFLDCINQVVQNCKDNHYGLTPVCPTGPNMIGKIVSKYMPCKWIHIGNYNYLTPSHKSKNAANIMADGLILCISKGTISLGNVGSNTNNYANMWQQNKIYNELSPNIFLKNLYRFILQRDPDNEAIISYNNKPITEVRDILLSSKEYNKLNQTVKIEKKLKLNYCVVKIDNRAIDNLENTKKILSDFKFNTFDFFNAHTMDFYNFFKKRNIEINWNKDRFGRDILQGEYGIMASQILCYEYMLDNNIKEMIVFEDDTVIDEKFIDKFYSCYNSLPKNWDYLADCSEFPHHTILQKSTNQILIGSNVICKSDLLNAHLGFMLYSISGAKKILNAIKYHGFTSPIDTFIYDQTRLGYLNGYTTFYKNKLVVEKDKYGTLIDTEKVRK
jgi:GR25 family glycosyltransferase involved in LPS biosynthesis